MLRTSDKKVSQDKRLKSLPSIVYSLSMEKFSPFSHVERPSLEELM